MNTTLTPLRKAKGSVLVLTALSLLLIMGMLGLAIDLSNTYVNKTRLQNALDAMALSAAISLVNGRPLNSVVSDARVTFDTYGLSSVDSTNDIDVCFFANYSLITAASPCAISTPTTSSKFVRAAIKPGRLLTVTTTFASVIGFTNTHVYASAVSGPLALNNLCTLAPMITCADMTTIGPGADGVADTADDIRTVTDPDCDTGGDCYGYTIGNNYTLKLTDWTEANVGSGNFGLLDVGTGANAVCDAMAGSVSCLVLGATADAQTGSEAGPTACLNVRFDDYTHGRNSRYPPATYPPDTNISEYLSTAHNSLASYLAGGTSPSNAGLAGRRVMHLPISDCKDGLSHGSTATLDIQAMGCFLITQKVIEGGSDPNKHMVFTEFIDAKGSNPGDDFSNPLCEIGSKSLPSALASPFAPTRVVLFKDPVSPDA